MKRLAIFLLISIWLCIYGCGDEASTPTDAADTIPPTIVGMNVQGGPIPVNTPIVLVFSERVDLTSAQRGISVLSSIDAEPVKGVVTIHKGGLEVKFTPTENMTSGGYVLTAIGIEDTAGNIMLTPISIFFGAVQVDTDQPAADIMPPVIVSSTPAEGQSTGSTDSLTVRFDEEIDPASAREGIIVSGVEGTVQVTGAVAIFKPLTPMQAGQHTMVIVGIRDLSGNVQASSLIVPFRVTAPPDVFEPPIINPPVGGGGPIRTSNHGAGVQIWFAAEDYSERDPDNDQFYLFVDKNGSLADKVMARAGADGGMISWTFDIRAAGGQGGEWYFWTRAINPSNTSDYMMVDGDPDDPIPAGPPYPGGDGTPPFDNAHHRVFEEDIAGGGFGWQIASHDEGHTKDLQNGVNTMYLFHRQGNDTRFNDIFMWTDDPNYKPTDDDYKNAR